MKTWTEEQLCAAVAQSRNISQVLRQLGLRPVGGNYATIRHYVSSLGLDTSHWGRSQRRIVPLEELRLAVAQADSVSSAIGQLGWPVTSASRRRFAGMIATYGLDVSHFLGQASHRGKRYPERVRPSTDYTRLNGPRVPSHILKRKLIEEGIFDPKCATCGERTWQGVPIPLELEHKNGNRNDNSLENLELLCPNCHALTPTYRGRNIGGYSVETA